MALVTLNFLSPGVYRIAGFTPGKFTPYFDVHAWGAGGASSNLGGNGSGGSYARSRVSVTNQTSDYIDVFVGEAGSGTTGGRSINLNGPTNSAGGSGGAQNDEDGDEGYGGGGGGASGVFVNGVAACVAGGGGGGGGHGDDDNNGANAPGNYTSGASNSHGTNGTAGADDGDGGGGGGGGGYVGGAGAGRSGGSSSGSSLGDYTEVPVAKFAYYQAAQTNSPYRYAGHGDYQTPGQVTLIFYQQPHVYTKVSGAWKNTSAIYVKQGGAWRLVDSLWTKKGGVWKAIIPSATPSGPASPVPFGR